jgi:hypothetical protein
VKKFKSGKVEKFDSKNENGFVVLAEFKKNGMRIIANLLITFSLLPFFTFSLLNF